MMNFNNKLMDIINNDLQIKKIRKESKANFNARIIYTALSIWIRTSVIPFADEENNKGIIINKIKKKFDEIVLENPEILAWYNSSKLDTHPVTEISKRLIKTGEIIEYGFNNELILPEFEKNYVHLFYYMYRGFNQGGYNIFSGLVPIMKEENNIFKKMNELSYFGMNKLNAVEFLGLHVKNSKWRKVKSLQYEIFDYSKKYNNSNCWVKEEEFSEFDITLYKNDFYDFGFIRKSGDYYLLSEINEFLIKEFEVRRFMYGLKEKYGEPSKSYYIIDDINQYVELILTSALPKKEESLFLLIGWPKNNISDNCNFIFHLIVWEIVMKVLERLNIELKEIVNE